MSCKDDGRGLIGLSDRHSELEPRGAGGLVVDEVAVFGVFVLVLVLLVKAHLVFIYFEVLFGHDKISFGDLCELIIAPRGGHVNDKKKICEVFF